MSKNANLDVRNLKNLALNESVDIAKGAVRSAEELVRELSAENAAYAYVIEPKTARIFTITRIVPEKLTDRAEYFSTIKKSQIQKALKQNNNVKTKAAESLGMSPRTLRRKLVEYGIPY